MVKTNTSEGLEHRLHALATQYETQDFIKDDPHGLCIKSLVSETKRLLPL